MLREPQHERKITNVIKAPPFVLSLVEGLRQGFSATDYCLMPIASCLLPFYSVKL